MPTLRPHRLIAAALAATALVAVTAAPAGACGGLVGENGTIQLTRTSTLAAYHDGVERYVTSFEFTGDRRVGRARSSRCPTCPTEVERGGDWTLQRLAQEVAPPSDFDAAEAGVRRIGGGQRRGAPRDPDRRPRHHHPAGRR